MTSNREEDVRHNERLNDYILNQSNNLDKFLLTLSSGAIGLIASSLIDECKQSQTYLELSLLFFTLTIIITVMSFSISIKSHEKEIRILNDQIAEKDNIDLFNVWIHILDWLSRISIISFLLGVTLLSLTYIKNPF